MKKYLIALVAIVLLPSAIYAAGFNTNLYYGLTNNTDVSALQEFLTSQGYYNGPISGNFFSLTLSGVKKFQTANSLPQSGYFGILSRGVVNNLLASEMSAPSQESGSFSTQTNVTNPTDYSTYTTVTFSQYSKNPSSYIGQNVIVEGMESNFLPSTGNGNSNFIQTTNLFDLTQPKIMFQVDDSGKYTTVVNTLQSKYYPFIRVYGTAIANKNFTQTNQSQTTTVSLPVISVSRVDWCPNAVQSSTYNGISLESDESCPSWTTITPTVTTSTSTVSPTTNSQSTFVTPSGIVLDQNGNVVSNSTVPNDKVIGEQYFVNNHTCVGLTDQNQYGYCISYSINH